MRKLLLILGMIMLFATSVAAAVVITPENPDTTDTLTCDVTNSNSIYNYYWFVNDELVDEATALSSTLAASESQTNDVVTCKAFRPASPFTPETYVGQDAVTIAFTFYAPGMFVYPVQPIDISDGFPDDGDIDVYNPPEGFPDDGDIDVYNPPEGFPDDGDIDVYDPAECSDNRDNDNDGLVDMDDPGCSNPQDDDESNPIEEPECSDNRDNDNDGLVDMDDPGCSNPQDDDERNFLPNPEEEPSEQGDGDARGLNLEIISAVVNGDNLEIQYVIENDGTMSVKNVELLISIPDYGITKVEGLGKFNPTRKMFNFASVKLPEGAQGTHTLLIEATGLGAHDSEQRTFTVAEMALPNINLFMFDPEEQEQPEKVGFFTRILSWFLNLFRGD